MIKESLKDFFKCAFNLREKTTGAQPKMIKESLKNIGILGDFEISCSFGSGKTSSTPYIAFKLSGHNDNKGVYPRVAMLKSSNHKVEISIVESYGNKVDYKAKQDIAKYDKDNLHNSFFVYQNNDCDYEAIIDKLEQDIDFFLSISKDRLKLL